MISVLVSTFLPFPTISLSLPSNTPISVLSHILSPICPPSLQSLSSSSHHSLPTLLSSLAKDGETVFLRLAVKLNGGKGGFASQLRAQGGRMSSNKVANNDSCRDLNGRRISTINKAQKLAEYIENAPVREAAAIKKSQDRLIELNAEIQQLDQGGDAGNKRRLEDNDFIEESRELVEGVRDAVKDAMMKKRKKNKESKGKIAPVEKVESKASGSGSTAAIEPIQATQEESAEVAPEIPVETEENVEVDVKGKGKGKAKK